MLKKDNEEYMETIKAENEMLKQMVASNEEAISKKDKQLENLNMGLLSLNEEKEKLEEENNYYLDCINSGEPDTTKNLMKEMQDKISKVSFHYLYPILAYSREYGE